MRTLRALGYLLMYPDPGWLEALPAIQEELACGELARPALQQLDGLLSELTEAPLLDLQQRYVDLFDRTRNLSLHLYEHVHGDSHERGGAMVQLLALYEQHGMAPDGRELPDFLPMLCEFLSLVDADLSRAVLADAATVLGVLAGRLTERGSAYAGVFEALLAVSGALADREVVDAVLAETSAQMESPGQLDEMWQESPVSFGEGAAHDSCQQTDLVQLRRGAP